MIKNFIKTALAIIVGAGFLVSCSDDDAPVTVAQGRAADATVSVSVRFNLPSTKAGDPGTGHPEFDQGWSTLAFYFVYSDGVVLTRTVTRDEFVSVNTFSVYEGDVTAYVAAFPAGHQVADGTLSRDEVTGMTTTPFAEAGVAGSEAMRDYMLGFFSGVSREMHVSSEQENEINVQLDRLVAKVDLQWDVQPGIDDNAFVSAAVSDITFKGCQSGYVFPDAAQGMAASAVEDLVTLDGRVSARNGRAYFYTFPGAGCGFQFDVSFGGGNLDGTTSSYDATFAGRLDGDEWHKVNMTVRGTNVAVDGEPVSITLSPTSR